MNIKFRSIEEGDLPQLLAWRNDDRLRHSFREYRLLNMINQRDWLRHISRSRQVEMFGILADQMLVGACGLCYINWVSRTAEPSIYIAPSSQHTDIAIQALKLLHQKAFEQFNLHRLWVEIYDFDTAKIALFENSGYVLEGRLRQHMFSLGQYHDSVMYGLLRDEAE